MPPGVRIRVGDEIREWRAGECLVFDDSFEHEVCMGPHPAVAPHRPMLTWMDATLRGQVWHDGTADRVVLICDAWHPEVRLDADVAPMLGAAERADLEAALAGEHRALAERGYSTGVRVRREP